MSEHNPEATDELLNKTLYLQLRSRFGDVRVVHAGEKVEKKPKPVWDSRLGRIVTRWEIDRVAMGGGSEHFMVRCFTGETLVMTPDGDRPIRELVGTPTLLIPNARAVGNWKQVEVRSFGVQPVVTLHLKRRRNRKTIRVTKDHRWVVSGRIGLYSMKTTEQLVRGDKLASCFARSLAAYGVKAPNVSVVGVAQGFVFGDGSCPSVLEQAASVRIQTASKDKALLPYFGNCRQVPVVVDGKRLREICDLPRSWKKLPDSHESLTFLLGWLAGYFAADGTVNKKGDQAVLYSATPAHLEFAKAILYRLGVRVSPVQRKIRGERGGCVKNCQSFPLYMLSFPARDLPDGFWIQQHHKDRAAAYREIGSAASKDPWVVEKVVDHGEREEVFCAVVPGIEKFTLADNLLTMNCPFCRDHKPRLYISYLWDSRTDETNHNYLWHANCWNENCLQDEQKRMELYEMVWGDILLPDVIVKDAEIRFNVFRKRQKGPPPLPDTYSPLSELPNGHPAKRYLLGRRFNPDWLSEYFGVGYCVRPQEEYKTATRRIIIPIYQDGAYAGWQARWVGDNVPKWATKYWTGTGTSRGTLLYNYDTAKNCPYMVLTEGPTDVWRYGPEAVCSFGKNVTGYQSRRLAKAGKPVIVLLDGDVGEAELENVIKYLRNQVQYRLLRLPPTLDPGSIPTEQLRALVESELQVLLSQALHKASIGLQTGELANVV